MIDIFVLPDVKYAFQTYFLSIVEEEYEGAIFPLSGNHSFPAFRVRRRASTPTPKFTIGGMVSGLSGKGLVLQDNGGDNLSVTASGNFTFATAVTSGGAYSVTVLTQPSGPAQNCVVTNGSGTASANVTNVQVACTTVVTRTIGGTVSNLAGTNGGLQLEDNGSDILNVNANGAFTFAMAVDDGSTYAVTVSMQPTNPAQTCGVVNGAGTATANVTNVMVDCGHNEWTWMGGSSLVDQAGVYGTLGTPAATNIPGGRAAAVTWTDASGNVWLFGGVAFLADGGVGPLNDLWRYSAGEWTWMGGSDLAVQKGTYGTLGSPAASNIPGGENSTVTWTDWSGNVWLFGGQGYDSAGTFGDLNDLWKYSGGEWTWMGGSNVANQAGTYGTLGTAAATNIPGARALSVTWTDASGNVWLFGGNGYDSAGTTGELNDLWKYSNGEWTWMGGSNVANQKGIYGTLGTAAASNIPGARDSAVTWTDPSGNVWLFGGFGDDSAGTLGELNDLWKYSNGEWTWMGGSNVVNQTGIYGTQGTPSASNVPGARDAAVAWVDASGNFWLFGGETAAQTNFLNDLWKYSNGQWTWMGGSDLIDQPGTYGTVGTPEPSNIPGARRYVVAWIDAQGNLWLFGGRGYDSTGTLGALNDLWRYEP